MNLRSLLHTFFSGLAVVLPIIVTIAVLMWLVGTAESVLGGMLQILLPSSLYFRGMGLIAGVMVILAAGFLTRAIFFRQAMNWVEVQMYRIPGVKTVYGAVRDLTNFLSKSDENRFSKVVLVSLPNLPLKLVGFVTVEDFSRLPFAVGDNDVAVYMPMSYQIGGYTALMPRECITPVDMTLEEAMRFVVTAGMSRREEAEPLAPATPVAPGRPI
jgi:uncharacterized membrane protein